MSVPVWSKLPSWSKRNMAILSTGLAMAGGGMALGNKMGEIEAKQFTERADRQAACAKTLGERVVRTWVNEACLIPLYGDYPTGAELSRSEDYLPTAADMHERAEANYAKAESWPAYNASAGVDWGLGIWLVATCFHLVLKPGPESETTRQRK